MGIASFERASEVTRGVSGDSDARELPFIVKLDAYSDDPDNDILDYVSNNPGTPDVYEAGNIPTSWDGMPRRKIDIEQLGPYWFVVRVRYSYEKGDDSQRDEDAVDKTTRQFRFAGTNTRIRIAEAQDKFGTNAIDHDKFIAVRKNKDVLTVEGEDALVPTQEFSLAYTNLASFFNQTYFTGTVLPLVTKVNDATYLGFAAGEVKFLGVTGSVEDSAPDAPVATFSFNFAYSPTVPSGKVVAGITINRDMEGWERIWVDDGDEADAVNKGLKKTARGVYVYKDYEYGDFSVLPS